MKNKNIAHNKSALNWLLKSIDPKRLLAFFKKKSNGTVIDIGSFRMNVDSFSKPIVLVKLANELVQDRKRFNLLLVDDTMPWNPYVKLISALDEDWIINHVDALFCFLANRYFLVALAADNRPRIGKLAIPFWEDSEIWTQEISQKGDSEFLTLFAPFIPINAIESPAHTVNKNLVEQLKKRLESEKLKQQALIVEKKEQGKVFELEIRRLKDEHKAKIKREKQHINKLENQIVELQQNSDVQIKQAVNHYKSVVLNFSRDEEQAKLDRDAFSSVEDLILAVDKQLDLHAAHNKKYGTYSRVRQQITALEKKLTQTNLCLNESLLVDNTLIQLRNNLQKEIQRLKSLPKIRGDFETEVDKYSELINQLPLVYASLERLSDLQQLFKNPEITILFGSKPRDLEQLISAKKIKIETMLAEKSLAQLPLPSSKHTYKMNVKRMLSKPHAPFYCLIDGCNVTLSHSFKNGFSHETSLSDRRQQFKLDCLKVAEAWKQIVIAYDSQSTTGNIEHDRNIQTVFVNKLTEDQNADNYIIRRLEVLNQQQIQPKQICLVTADRDLQFRAQAYCENIITPDSFLQYLLRK